MNLEFIKPVYGAVKSVNGMTGDVVIEVPETNLEGYATEEYVARKIAEAELAQGDVNLSAYYTKSETEAKIDEKIAAIEHPTVDLSEYAKKSEIPSTVGLATEQYVNEAIAGIEIPEGTGIKHITITDATELLNLEDGFYVVDNEFTVNTIQGEFTFSDALSVKQDALNYTFIDYSAYLSYNNGDKTWDYSAYAFAEDIVALQEQIDTKVTQEVVDTAINTALANSGFQTEEQVSTKVGNILSGQGYQNRPQVQQIVTEMVPTLDIDASQVKHIKGNPANGYVLEGGEYTLQQMANAFDNQFKNSANSLTPAQKNIVDTAISEAIAAIPEVDLSGYQEKLTAGDNITIEGNVISATGGSGGGSGGNVAVDNTTIIQNPDGTISTAIGGGRVLASEPVIYIDYNDETGVTTSNVQSNSCYVPVEQFDFHIFDEDTTKKYLLTVEIRDKTAGDERTKYSGYCTITTDYYGATLNPVNQNDFDPYLSRFYYSGGTSIICSLGNSGYETADKIYIVRFTLEEPAQYTYQRIDSNFLNVDLNNSFDITTDGQLKTKFSGIKVLNSEKLVFGLNDTSFDSTAQRTFVFGAANNITEKYYNSTYWHCGDTVVFGDNNRMAVNKGASIGSQNSGVGGNVYMLGAGLRIDGSNKLALGTWNESNRTEPIQFGIGTSSNNRLTGMTIDSTGNAVFKGTVSNGGADYAEYFEWVDGNPEAEDRIGYMVTLEGDKIRFAAPGDEILGIISGTAAMIGDDAQWHWSKKYLTDEFGRIQHEYVEIKTEAFDADGNPVEQIEKVKTLKLNPDWDENASYVSRKERKEWDIVGMFGKLYVRDDGTCAVGGYARVGANGVATNSAEKTNMRIMERVNDNIIKVFMK